MTLLGLPNVYRRHYSRGSLVRLTESQLFLLYIYMYMSMKPAFAHERISRLEYSIFVSVHCTSEGPISTSLRSIGTKGTQQTHDESHQVE